MNSARPQDRVKVIRGTNQKNQLEQEAWKLVIKIMILQNTMKEEEEREAQKIIIAASDAGTLEAAAPPSANDLNAGSRTTSASGGGASGGANAVVDRSFGRSNSSAAAMANLFGRAESSFKTQKGSSLVNLMVLIKEKILSTKAKFGRWVGPYNLKPIKIKERILMIIMMIAVTAGQRRSSCSFCRKRIIDSNQTQLEPSP